MAIVRTSARSGPADAVLHRPADRRPELERGRRARRRSGTRWPEASSSFVLQPLARRDVLGDDHRLAEEVVRQLHVERQVEADRAAADIGAPALDVGIALQSGVEARRRRSRSRRSRRSAAGSGRPAARGGRRPGRTAAAPAAARGCEAANSAERDARSSASARSIAPERSARKTRTTRPGPLRLR